MSTTDAAHPVALEDAVVLRVHEDRCRVVRRDEIFDAGYPPQFPSPRVERVSPGHRVALATAPDGRRVVVWRWYDAVVVGAEGGRVRLWEPGHGEVLAAARESATGVVPGARAYLSAGLPGAEWWVASSVAAAEVELAEVAALYTDHDLWDAAFTEG